MNKMHKRLMRIDADYYWKYYQDFAEMIQIYIVADNEYAAMDALLGESAGE